MSEIKPIKNIDTQDFNRAVDLANSVITTMVEMWCKNIIPNLVTDIINNEFKPIYDSYTKDFTDLADKLILQYTQNAETKEKELQDLHDKLITNFIDVAGTTVTDLNELIPIAKDLLEKLQDLIPTGQDTNTNLQENIDKASTIINDIENLINEFNQNAQEKTDEFNKLAEEKLEELQNITPNIDEDIRKFLSSQTNLILYGTSSINVFGNSELTLQSNKNVSVFIDNIEKIIVNENKTEINDLDSSIILEKDIARIESPYTILSSNYEPIIEVIDSSLRSQYLKLGMGGSGLAEQSEQIYFEPQKITQEIIPTRSIMDKDKIEFSFNPTSKITYNKDGINLNKLDLFADTGALYIESKTFDNGYYIKFADGTLIQSLVGTLATDTITWVFHVEFKDTEYIPSSFSIVPYKPIITKQTNMLSYKFDGSISIDNFLTGMIFFGRWG
ncbi:MAG: hypothetical protein ACRC31_05420 [Cetobacterium sp.]